MIDNINKEAIEEWFAYESLEEDELLSIQYINCTVQKPFGPYSIGDKLSLICVDYLNGSIDVFSHDYDEDKITQTFSATLTFNIVGIDE